MHQSRQLAGGISISVADGVDRFVLFRNANALIRLCKGETVHAAVDERISLDTSTSEPAPGSETPSEQGELPQGSGLAAALATCSSIESTEARLLCFEAVSGLASSEQANGSKTSAANQHQEAKGSFTAGDKKRFLQLAGAVLGNNPFYYFENIENCVYKREKRWTHLGKNFETSFVIPLAQVDAQKSHPGEMAVGSTPVQVYRIHAKRGRFFDVKDRVLNRISPERYVSRFVARNEVLEFEGLLKQAVASCQQS